MAEPLAKKFCDQGASEQRFLRKNLINPSEIKRALFSDVKEPLVFRGYLEQREETSETISSWNCLQWDAKAWGKLFGEKHLDFRFGTKVSADEVLSAPQWESTCLRGSMTYEEFLVWSGGEGSFHTSSCGHEMDQSRYWAYFDYFYMKDTDHHEEIKEVIDWSIFGFTGRGYQDSTLWIGTAGANTPCHIDTYGCNLVAQVLGKKRWILFPKSQSQYLSPTRIPYEESSIYSNVGFPRPCLFSHPELCSTTPYVVTLEPGDVLFVPNQWWHFVESLEFSVSINTWLELPSDDHERAKEALVMYQIGSLCQGIESVSYLNSVFNPNMMNIATMTSSDLLQLLASKVFQVSDGETQGADGQGDVASCSKGFDFFTKKPKQSKGKQGLFSKRASCSSGIVGHHLYTLNWSNDTWCEEHGVNKVSKISFDTYITQVLESNIKMEYEKSLQYLNTEKSVDSSKGRVEDDSGECIDLKHLKVLIDSFSDYRVVDLIKKVIDEKLQKDYV